MDPVIKERHNGYDPRSMKHPTDLDASKVRPRTPPLGAARGPRARLTASVSSRCTRPSLTSATCCPAG